MIAYIGSSSALVIDLLSSRVNKVGDRSSRIRFFLEMGFYLKCWTLVLTTVRGFYGTEPGAVMHAHVMVHILDVAGWSLNSA